MAYTALYRKYRPTAFADVKGQDHIVTTLKNQISAGRIGHAYLFCGTRGTGKTTVAKILAKAVNCEHPTDGSPCGECESCRAIAAGSSMNVIEIDAASNNGVENIRQIREEVSYPPTEGKYKVYIIDEAHMLSTGAFNALLKTLEEPPEYVIFILATTEANKLPATIVSRCQRYDFRRIGIETIAARLADLLAGEGVEAEEKAIRYVARAADGSMRDALSLLDQCIAFYLGERLTLDKVLDVLGAADTEVFSRLLRALMAQDVSGAVRILEEIIMQGRELGQFVTDFIWYLRNLLLIKSADDMEDVLDMSGENLALLKEEAQAIEDDTILRYIHAFSELSTQMKYADEKRVLLEIAIIRLCRPAMEAQPDALAERVAFLEKQVEQGVPGPSPAQEAPREAAQPAEQPTRVPEDPPEHPEAKPASAKAPMPKAVPDDIQRVVKNWHSIRKKFSGGIRAALAETYPSLGEEGQLLLVFDDPEAYGFLTINGREQEIEKRISEQMGKEIPVLFRENDTGKPAEEIYPNLEEMIRAKIEVEDE